MIHGKSVLAVIPARGGSKRLPRKNLQNYKGKSLIRLAVDSARHSKYIDELVLSTEDAHIAEHAQDCGVKVVLRPDWLAHDQAMNEGVLIHTLYTHRWADWIVLLQPTSPQRTAEDIDTCIERAHLGNGNGCITLDEYGKRNGAVYVARSEYLIASMSFAKETFHNFLTMPLERSLDVDYEQDLHA
jgi:CMP-N,N'-diacetyllegionaminic acid synthase